MILICLQFDTHLKGGIVLEVVVVHLEVLTIVLAGAVDLDVQVGCKIF